MQTILNLHGLIPASRVNGPGTRKVVFFQGCGRACPSCFNSATHDFAMNKPATVAEVLSDISPLTEGLTISGGEPFSQPRGLGALLRALSEKKQRLSIVVYTGFTLGEIKADKVMAPILSFIDVLVAGPFDALRPEKTLLARGSSNQIFHFLTPRYTISDFYLPARIEVTIGTDGSMTGTGFSRFSAVGDYI